MVMRREFPISLRGAWNGRGRPCERSPVMVYDGRLRSRRRERRVVVKLDHIYKEYQRGSAVVTALRDVSLEIEGDEFCAVMGPSGCGKSTLLNLIAGLDTPTSGAILLNGRPTAQFSDNDWTRVRRDSIGMVFQAFHLIPSLTAGENVALSLLLSHHDHKTVEARVGECLEAVGLGHREQHRPAELSGGEQQRVAIARALVHRPALLLADEPTGNLDSQQGGEIMALLRSVSSRFGTAVLLATHSAEAARQADRLYRLRDGCLEQPAGSPGS
jgi:putative ABC transport system ATP-binding protein